MLPVRMLSWSWMQLRGTTSNVRAMLGAFSLDRILPSGITGFVLELLNKLAFAAGRGSRTRGLFSGITLIILGVLTSWTGVGIVLIVIGGILAVFNVARHVPVINQLWEGSRAQRAISKDRDVPLFRQT
jgi:hypothetical protein